MRHSPAGRVSIEDIVSVKQLWLSRVAAGRASVGYLVLVYPPIVVAQDPSIPYSEFLRARPVLMAAGMLATIGVTLLGAAVLRARAYPAWVGWACLTSPLVFAGVMLVDGPALVGFAANTILGGAFVVMGTRAHRTLSLQRLHSPS